MPKNKLAVRHGAELSTTGKRSEECCKQLALELYKTAANAKTEVEETVTALFLEEFQDESPSAIQGAFKLWRRRSPYFPSLTDLRQTLNEWREQLRLELANQERLQFNREVAEARQRGELIEGDAVAKVIASVREQVQRRLEKQDMNASQKSKPEELQIERPANYWGDRREVLRQQAERVQGRK